MAGKLVWKPNKGTKALRIAAPITQRFNWTNGCIAITNSEMDEFMELVDIGTSIQIEW